MTPRALLGEEASFAPLFRLLDDFDTYSRHSPIRIHNRMPTFTPRFDMRETQKSFELYGELPGIDKKNVSVEFTDPQTIVIKGSVERHYEAGTRPAGLMLDQSAPESATDGSKSSPRPHHATVQDADDAGNERVKEVVHNGTPKQAHDENATKYWVSERSTGQFSRSFGFPTPVDQDAVSASLNDGILNVSVPKARKSASRTITIN